LKDILPLEWLGDRVRILDQSQLPHKEVYLDLRTHQEIASAVLELKIRGAPAIGLVIAYAMALASLKMHLSVKGYE
jgi:methylthioribose-1-phosphate isomerase